MVPSIFETWVETASGAARKASPASFSRKAFERSVISANDTAFFLFIQS